MEHQLEMIEFRQNIQAFSEPMQKLEARIASGRIGLSGHPVFRAHAQATTVTRRHWPTALHRPNSPTNAFPVDRSRREG